MGNERGYEDMKLKENYERLAKEEDQIVKRLNTCEEAIAAL
jgi:hypothetical protein